jgi:hypothetical protein
LSFNENGKYVQNEALAKLLRLPNLAKNLGFVAFAHPNRCISFQDSSLFPFLSYLIEGSLEVKLPTIWTDEKQRREEAERRERLEERRVEERKSKKKEKE